MRYRGKRYVSPCLADARSAILDDGRTEGVRRTLKRIYQHALTHAMNPIARRLHRYRQLAICGPIAMIGGQPAP